MPSWKKVITSGPNAVLNQITASGDVTIDSKLGIGTTSPDEGLHLKSKNILFERAGYDTGDQIKWKVGGNDRFTLRFDTTAGGLLFFNEHGGVGNHLFLDRLEAHVGIGTTTPTSELTVQGDISASGDFLGSSTSTGSFGSLVVADAIQGNTTLKGGNLIFDAYKGPKTNSEYLYITSTRGVQFIDHGAGTTFHVDGAHQKIYNGSPTIAMQTYFYGNLRLDQGNYDITGSATSTASFGRIQATTIGGNSPLTIESPTLSGDTDIDGNLTVTGDITAQNYIVSSSVTSINYQSISGSTIFGDSTDDTHQFTGSLNLSGSLTVEGASTTTSGDANAGITLKAGGEKILQGWNEGNVNIGNGTFTTAYKIMLHGKTKVQNADIIVDQNKKYGWGNETVYLAGSEANGIDFYHSSTHLGRWRTAGLSVNTNVTASGNIEVAGNISGSSTSTGSFGAVTIGAVPDNDVDHPFELQGNMRIDGDIYSFSSGVRGYPRRYISFGLGLELYTAGDTHEYNHKLKNMSGRNLLWVSGDGAKVSGSSDSTGSFGRLEVLGGGNDTSIRIKGHDGNGNHVDNSDTYGIIQFDGLDDNGDYITGAQIKVAADSPTGAGDMPSSIQFFTRADGGSLTQAYKIDDEQRHRFYGRGHFYSDQTYFGAEGPDGENTHSQIVVKAGVDTTGGSTHRSAWVQLRNARTSGGGYNYTDWLMGVHGSNSTNAPLVFSNSNSMAGGSTWAQSSSLAIYPPGTYDRKVDVYKDLNVGVDDAGGNLTVYGNISGSSTSTGSFGSVSTKKLNVGSYYVAESGGTPVTSGDITLGSTNTGKKVGLELYHSSNPVSFKLHYDSGGGAVTLDNVHQNYINDFIFKKAGTEYHRIGTALNTTSNLANNFFIKSNNTSYDFMILDHSSNPEFYIDTSTRNVGVGEFHRNNLPDRRLHIWDSATDGRPAMEVSSSNSNGASVQITGTYPGITFNGRGRIWYDGAMTIDNAGDAARPIKIRTQESTAASGKDTAVIRIMPSGSTSGYFDAHGGVLLGRNHQRADSQQTYDHIVHISASADHGLMTLQDSNVNIVGNISGSVSSTGSFGALQVKGSPLINGNSTGIGIGSGASAVSPNHPFVVSNGASSAAKFIGNAGQVSLTLVPNEGNTSTSLVALSTIFSIRPGGTTVLNALSSGRVGIGTTNPQKILHINDGTYNLQIDGNELFHSDSNPFYIKSAETIHFQPSQTTTLVLEGNKISGSGESTGSFGSVFVGDINNGKSLSIGDNTRGNHKIYDNQGYLRFDSSIWLGNGYIYVGGTLNLDAGANDIRLGSSSGGANTVHFKTDGSTDGTTITKNHITASGNFSSSLASTGSFGAISVKNGGSPQIFGNSNGIGINNASDIDHDLDVQGTLRVSDAIHGFHDTTGRVYQRKWIQFGPNTEHHASHTDRHVAIYADQTTDSPILKVGGGTGYTRRVGINTLTPLSTLHVKGDGLVHGDLDVTGSLTVQGDIIAENYIVSSSTTYMTTSFSAGSTAFGDTQDDNHDFTGSLNVTGSISIEPNNSDVTAVTEASLYLRGPNQGIKMQRYNSSNTGAYAHLYLNGNDYLVVKTNGNNSQGIATDRIGSLTQTTTNNYIHFDGFDKDFYGYHEGASTPYETHDTNGISIMLNEDHTFKVSGSLIEFTPTEKVSVTGNLELDGALTEASTMRIKTNIETLESPLDKISKLRGVSYNLKRNNEPSIGMIAEEVEEVFPELVSKDDSGKASAMSYGRMTAVLLEAIKELKEEVDELKQENIYMKQMNRKNK